MEFIIAIPSFDRPELIAKRTLALLFRHSIPAVDVTELDHDFNVITGQEYKGVDTMCLTTIASIGMGINVDLFNEIKANVDDPRCGYKYISNDGQVIVNKYIYS